MCVRVCVSACDRPCVRDRLCEWFASLRACVCVFASKVVCVRVCS